MYPTLQAHCGPEGALLAEHAGREHRELSREVSGGSRGGAELESLQEGQTSTAAERNAHHHRTVPCRWTRCWVSFWRTMTDCWRGRCVRQRRGGAAGRSGKRTTCAFHGAGCSLHVRGGR